MIDFSSTSSSDSFLLRFSGDDNFLLEFSEEPYHDNDDDESGPSSSVREPKNPIKPQNNDAIELELIL
jgi:hypothetical protein